MEVFNLPSTVSFFDERVSDTVVEPNAIDFKTTINGVLDNAAKTYPAITWPNGAGKLKNYGDTLKFTPASLTAATFDRGTNGGGVFNLIQWHIHAPSEHRVDGLDYPAEIHCSLLFVMINDMQLSTKILKVPWLYSVDL